jgi:hypothetical protein
MSPAPLAIVDLVERFDHNRALYHRPEYNETQVRVEFIDPLFEALGWDVRNLAGFAPQYQDVTHEAAVRIGGSVHAPDYCFQIGGKPLFYVEAKKPAVNVQADAGPAYQLRRYAWTKKLPLSILTDFEAFSVYEGRRVRPQPTDGPATARVMCVEYTQYVDKWDELAGLFSKQAVQRGDYDRFAESASAKRGTQEVDEAFLAELGRWRELLARNLALRNPTLTVRGLNHAVQLIIDRLVFLRIAEDRGIEPYGQLQDVIANPGAYARLLEVFSRADARYNSGLFHLRAEKGREQPDILTPRLALDDAALRDIVAHLYYPDCPYEFSVLGADILGNVYEQFLGSVIRLTAGHRAVVEQKPEVRKAGGVYYTPRYIVDYIVRQTVGRLVADAPGKPAPTPAQVAKLRVLDPACGSGSFLLGAYQFLLDWHLTWYVEHPTRQARKELWQDARGQWRLTAEEKKRILLNNIYGVDIDAQAVEVTKLSLLLKVLEGETEGSLGLQMEMFRQRALPDLGANIQCGNSLIGPDYMQQGTFLDEEELYRVNPFDWEKAFPEAFAAGGFDAVIGNPPYSAKQSVETKRLMAFFDGVEYKCDPYAFFVEQGLRRLQKGGLLGFIVPVTWMTNVYYRKLRELLIRTLSLKRIVLMDGLVFSSANVDTCMLFLHKESVTTREFEWLRTVPGDFDRPIVYRTYQQTEAEDRYDIVPAVNERWSVIRAKADQASVRLDSLGKISLGMKLRANKEFVASPQDAEHPDPIYFGNDISRYGSLVPTRFFDSAKAVIVGGTKKPAIHRFKPKILIQAIRNLSLKRRIVGALDPDGRHFVGTLNAFTSYAHNYDIRYILGLVNSTLLNTYFRQRFTTMSLTAAFLGVLPIRTIDFTNPAETALHAQMVALVECMLDLHRRLPTAETPGESTPHGRALLERQIAITDAEIDKLVYRLYDLTPEEIALVEGAG